MAPSRNVGQKLSGTNRADPPLNLSLVEEHYRQAAEVQGFADDYCRAVDAVRNDLLGLAQQDVNAAYLLHVLACTRFHRFTPNWQAFPALASLSARQRSDLLGAVRTFRKRGEKLRLFPGNPPTYLKGQEREYELQKQDWEYWSTLYFGSVRLEASLAQGSYRTPAFQFGGRSRPGRRQQELIHKACVVELMREVKPAGVKPEIVIFTLLDKFNLLLPGQRRVAPWTNRLERTAAWIKKLYQRNRTKAEDWKSPLGRLVMMLFRQSFEGLKRELLPEQFEPVPEALIRRRAKSWGTSEGRYRKGFERYCQLAGIKPDHEGLQTFEWALRQGVKGLVTVKRTKRGERPVPALKRSQVFRSSTFLLLPVPPPVKISRVSGCPSTREGNGV